MRKSQEQPETGENILSLQKQKDGQQTEAKKQCSGIFKIIQESNCYHRIKIKDKINIFQQKTCTNLKRNFFQVEEI